MPTRVGQGKRAFADVDEDKLNLELIGTHEFGNGVVTLKFRPADKGNKPPLRMRDRLPGRT